MRMFISSTLVMTLVVSVSLAQSPSSTTENKVPELPIPSQAPLLGAPQVTNQPASAPVPHSPVPQPPQAAVDATPDVASQEKAHEHASPVSPQPKRQAVQNPEHFYGHASPWVETFVGDGVNPEGAEGLFVGPSQAGFLHVRYPYYSYRRPWYTRGPVSLNVDIIW